MIREIGKMVSQLRNKLLVTQENLGRGLLSVPELSKLEHGDKVGDSFLMTALFQRLGKSMDQFEMTVSNDEYKLILLRAFIQESMESGDYDRTEELLDEYEDSKESKKLLHQQYIGLLRTVLAYLRGEDKWDCLEKFKDALEKSFKDEGRYDWSSYRFYIQEIQLLLMIAHLEMEVGENEEALRILKKLHDCINVTYTSEVTKVQVYPKCCYLLAKAYLETGKKDKAYEIAENGIQNLVKTRFLTFMEELLLIQQECRFDEERKAQIDAIRFVYELAEYEVPEVFVVKLLFSGISEEVTLNNELIREMRIAQGLTQDEASGDICSRETLARIENGRTPSKKKLKALLQRLGIEREPYSGYVVTDDWDTYELVRDYKRNCFEENHEDALDILEDIEARLDMTMLENKQFIETAKLRYKIKKKQISNEKAIKRLKELLAYTMPEYDGKLVRIPTREEFIILNRMALCLKWSGEREMAVTLYEELLQKYQASKVRPEHHTHAMMLLYLNYFAALYEFDDIVKAVAVGEIGMRLMLRYQRADFLAVFLANLACIFKESEIQAREMSVMPSLNASYHILDLYKIENKKKAVRKYIEMNYTAGLPKLGP